MTLLLYHNTTAILLEQVMLNLQITAPSIDTNLQTSKANLLNLRYSISRFR